MYEQLGTSAATLQFFNTAEGYVEPDGSGGYDYIFQCKDHLGNIRLSYSDANDNGSITTSEIREENNYYPFGLKHKGYNENISGRDHTFEYQGQELTEDLDYNMLEYKWRHFEPAIGRFNKLDRFAEKYTPISPYSFIASNPLKYREVQGDSIQLIIGKPYTDYKGKEHPYGHVALRVFNAEEGYDYVYDFGRYGAVRGVFGQTGDGILNVYNNSEAYFKTEQSIRESIGYTEATTVAQDKKIIDYYNKQIAEGESYSKRNTKNSKSYKLDDYGIFDNNCCTISADGLDQIEKNPLGDEYDPRDALRILEKDYKKLGLTRTVYKKGGITITTYEPAKPNSSGKSGNQKYDERPIPRVKDPEE